MTAAMCNKSRTTIQEPETAPVVDGIKGRPSRYAVISALACPDWCELSPDHDADRNADQGQPRVHRAVIFDLDRRAHVSVAEYVYPDMLNEDEPHLCVDFWALQAEITRPEAERVATAVRTACDMVERIKRDAAAEEAGR